MFLTCVLNSPVCPPAIHGSGFTKPLLLPSPRIEISIISWLLSPRWLLITTSPTSPSLFVNTRSSETPGKIICHLCQEVIFHAPQEPLRSFPFYYTVFPTDIGKLKVPMRTRSGDLATSANCPSSATSSWLGGLQYTPHRISTLFAFSLILMHKHLTLPSRSTQSKHFSFCC